jgi:hypothetical protein
MSIFASQTKKTITVGGDVDVIIRKLSAASLRKAREVRMMEDAKHTRAIGGEVLKALHGGSDDPQAPKKEPTPEQKKNARFALYDREDLLLRGIESWTAEKPVDTGIAELDEETSRTIFEAIVELALGPLEPAAVEEGKG